MKYHLFLAKITVLRGLIDPSWIDGGPGQPGPLVNHLSEASIDLILSEQIRTAAQLLHHAELGKKLHGFAKHMATDAISRLGVAWEDGDDICPPWHVGPHGPPRPHGWDWVALNPQPLPPKEIAAGATRDVLIAVALRDLSGLTSSEKFNKELQGLGQEIVRASASLIFDDYCGTPVPHRLPPRPGPRH